MNKKKSENSDPSLSLTHSLSLSLSLSLIDSTLGASGKAWKRRMRDALEHCRQLLHMGLCEFPAQNDGDSDDLSIPEHNFKLST
jgi:hypothetical protein